MSRRKLPDRFSPWSPLQPAIRKELTEAQIREHVAHALRIMPDADPEKVRAMCTEDVGDLWKNDRYTVHVLRFEGEGPGGCAIVQLSIRRNDRAPARDWRDFQRIKNQLVGPECEAVELYPAESRVVDTANQFHLWVVADPAYRWPVGFHAGRVVSSESSGGSVQRPLQKAEINHE